MPIKYLINFLGAKNIFLSLFQFILNVKEVKMSATDLLTSLFRTNFYELDKKEKTSIEVLIFKYIYQELKTYYGEFFFIKMEGLMPNGAVICNLLNDLISSNEYSIAAVASYTGYPEDVIYDLAGGINLNPTVTLSTKIIELHSISRPDFYKDIIKKICEKIDRDLVLRQN